MLRAKDMVFRISMDINSDQKTHTYPRSTELPGARLALPRKATRAKFTHDLANHATIFVANAHRWMPSLLCSLVELLSNSSGSGSLRQDCFSNSYAHGQTKSWLFFITRLGRWPLLVAVIAHRENLVALNVMDGGARRSRSTSAKSSCWPFIAYRNVERHFSINW